MTTAPLATWRAEIVAELAEAERELAEALAAKVASAAAHTAAAQRHRAEQELAAGFHRPIPASLARRLDPGGSELRHAEGAVTRTALLAEQAERTTQDLRAGLAEVERLLAASADATEIVGAAA
ncbi:MAG TPA: hypothetical protein VNF49_13460 [Candidatus Binataceae bacterium]|nr:hypothetical protein [Candidatus Binataceae bacterium]